MKTIIGSGECGNSPKNAMMERIAIAIFDDPQNLLQAILANDVTLHLADGTFIEGSDAVYRHITGRLRRGFDILKIEHAITHGRVGAANGLLADQTRQTGFGIFVDFASAKADRLKAIRIYGL